MNAPFNPADATALVRRANIEEIVARRDHAIAQFESAHGALAIADEAVRLAQEAARAASPGTNRYNYHLGKEKAEFHGRLKLPSLDDYRATARRMIDTDVWSHIIGLTDLERLMDKKAKDQFHQQLMSDPPEVTVDNVCATLQQFMLDAGMIWRRGIAECFSGLERRFRSHDGWKIGGRIILTYAFSEWGGWNYGRNHEASLIDVERVFRILDNAGDACEEAVSILRSVRNASFGRHQSECDTSYFKLRAYKNGNLHVWFQRDDLLEKVNQLLGEYYGAPIPEDREPDEDNNLFNFKTLPAKRYAFFPTPDGAADHLLCKVHLAARKDHAQVRVLEPSAGTGNLAFKLVAKAAPPPKHRSDEDYRFDATVDCVEIQPQLASALRARRKFGKVYTADFLTLKPETTGLYDWVVMNPPFDRERDIDHVLHALSFLKPDGRLVAIMSAGTEFRETRKSIAFRALMEKMHAYWEDLPARSFSEVGTNCNTLILAVCKSGEQRYWR